MAQWIRGENPTESTGQREQEGENERQSFQGKTSHRHPEHKVFVLASEKIFSLSMCLARASV